MLRHKFRIGQTVELFPGRLDRNVPRGIYTVQRLMPAEGREPQYRVKSKHDGHERVVIESQLSAPPLPN